VSDRQSKNELFDGFASVAKALAAGRRAELVDVLAQGERTVDALASEINQSLANTSQHLQVLARAGLVTSRRDGTRIHYRLASDTVVELWTLLRAVAAERVAGFDDLVRAYVGDREGLEPIARAELLQRMRDPATVVLDVRPTTEYESGHIAGAESIPFSELRRRIRSIPKDREVVAYCRGPYCVYADDAVRLLRRRGYRAHRLEDGYPEWKKAGLPVSVGIQPKERFA
jgi:rhodanese-related sulfurtransferase/DNA-binding transcriptional ArsR family regulator